MFGVITKKLIRHLAMVFLHQGRCSNITVVLPLEHLDIGITLKLFQGLTYLHHGTIQVEGIEIPHSNMNIAFQL